MPMIIRSARDTDAVAILALAQAFATSFVVREEAFHRAYAAVLASPDAYLAVAEIDQQIVGYLLGFDHETFYANGRVAWVEEVMVHEDWRRQGIGQSLMQALERWARTRGNRLISLATRRAAPFYRALGYEDSAMYFRKVL